MELTFSNVQNQVGFSVFFKKYLNNEYKNLLKKKKRKKEYERNKHSK